ncbi:MAG: cellulase [Alcaligenaceae bacterium]|nr:cellulase [Alcaligenaceae bacterium]
MFKLTQWMPRALLSAVLMLPVLAQGRTETRCSPPDWPHWNQFVRHFVQDSGRVLDATTPRQHSTSESQSYGMFFALVAGDRPTFDKMWSWSINNLGAGDLTKRLPAWLWGKADDGTWRVIDPNSASDADLWFAYALLEAGRLWREPAYTQAAQRLLTLVEGQEILYLPGFGLMLSPGRDGFAKPDQGTWVLNPSYMPVPVLRRLAQHAPAGPWNALANNTRTLLEQASPAGFAPDWTRYTSNTATPGFGPDPDKGNVGSYDAIRTYLWAGMTPREDPLFAPVLAALRGMTNATAQSSPPFPPEKVDTRTGTFSGTGPFGFSAALLPYFQALGHTELAQKQLERVQTAADEALSAQTLQKNPPPYYDYMLTLFGLGWYEQRYRFMADGTLSLPWEATCRGRTQP